MQSIQYRQHQTAVPVPAAFGTWIKIIIHSASDLISVEPPCQCVVVDYNPLLHLFFNVDSGVIIQLPLCSKY